MKKNLLLLFICLVLLLNVFGCVSSSVADENTKVSSLEENKVQSTKEPPPTSSFDDEIIAKAIWQDPNNVVLLWSSSINYEYSIYRSNNSNTGFEYIGETATESYRDATAKYPNEYYYKIKAKNPQT